IPCLMRFVSAVPSISPLKEPQPLRSRPVCLAMACPLSLSKGARFLRQPTCSPYRERTSQVSRSNAGRHKVAACLSQLWIGSRKARAVSTMPALSVIICTHNPRPDYFRQCLDALSRQTLVRNRWELIAVDNRSDEPLAGRNDLSWGPAARLVREETLGLTPARLHGIRESKSDL